MKSKNTSAPPRPRWRYATRDKGYRDNYERMLWTRKPSRYGPVVGSRAWRKGKASWAMIVSETKPVTKEYFIRRFGRDLKPGEIVKLP